MMKQNTQNTHINFNWKPKNAPRGESQRNRNDFIYLFFVTHNCDASASEHWWSDGRAGLQLTTAICPSSPDPELRLHCRSWPGKRNKTQKQKQKHKNKKKTKKNKVGGSHKSIRKLFLFNLFIFIILLYFFCFHIFFPRVSFFQRQETLLFMFLFRTGARIPTKRHTRRIGIRLLVPFPVCVMTRHGSEDAMPRLFQGVVWFEIFARERCLYL